MVLYSRSVGAKNRNHFRLETAEKGSQFDEARMGSSSGLDI